MVSSFVTTEYSFLSSSTTYCVFLAQVTCPLLIGSEAQSPLLCDQRSLLVRGSKWWKRGALERVLFCATKSTTLPPFTMCRIASFVWPRVTHSLVALNTEQTYNEASGHWPESGTCGPTMQWTVGPAPHWQAASHSWPSALSPLSARAANCRTHTRAGRHGLLQERQRGDLFSDYRCYKNPFDTAYFPFLQSYIRREESFSECGRCPGKKWLKDTKLKRACIVYMYTWSISIANIGRAFKSMR